MLWKNGLERTRLSRTMTRLYLAAQSLAVLSLITGCLLLRHSGRGMGAVIFGIGFLLFIISICLYDSAGRCPHCGAPMPYRSIGFSNWSGHDAGYCRNCGKKMVYDDQTSE